MPEQSEVTVDVTEAAGLGELCHLAATVTVPDGPTAGTRPVVCFGFPGGGYSRRYYTFDMPGADDGGQAGWHAARGWVFVAVDHLGVGDSSLPDPVRLTYENVAAANAAAVRSIETVPMIGACWPRTTTWPLLESVRTRPSA